MSRCRLHPVCAVGTCGRVKGHLHCTTWKDASSEEKAAPPRREEEQSSWQA
jgi:hypothetical protein